MRRLLVLSILLAACQRKPEVPTCEMVAERVYGLLTPQDEFARDVRDVFAKRCESDRWSDDARKCLYVTTATDSPQNCKKKLSAVQAHALDTDVAAAGVRDKNRISDDACGRYERALASLGACAKAPAGLHDTLAGRYREQKAIWAKATDRTEAASICSAALTQVRAVAADCPGADKW